MKKRGLTILLLFVSAAAGAQELSVSVAENIFTQHPRILQLVQEPRQFQAFDIGVYWNTSDTEAARLFGAPRIGIGFSYANLGSCACVPGSRMGDSFTLYGRFERTLLHWGFFSAGYDLELGGALMTKYYDRFDNPDNTLYGGPYSNHIKADLFGRMQLSQHLALTLEVGFRHNSTGRVFIPNSGLNSYSYALGASYAVGDRTLRPGARRPEADPLEQRFRVGIFAAGGIHRCMAEYYADQKFPPEERQDSYTPWFKGSLGAEVVWRYSRRTSTGAQVELHYLSNTEALRRADTILYGAAERSYSPFAPGIGLTQELYFGSFTAGIGLGAYLFRAMGEREDHGPLYQKVFIRYYPPKLKRFFAGVAIRAHYFNQADYAEISFGTIL